MAVLGILSSCRTTETYIIVGQEEVVFYDTIVFPEMHIHTLDSNCQMCHTQCFWLEEWKCDYTDTITIEIIEKRKIRNARIKR